MIQDKNFIEKRDKLRHFLQMKRFCSNNQLYMKMIGQKVNGNVNATLTAWEVEQLRKDLDELELVIDEFKQILK